MNFTAAETDAQQFVNGFAQGFANQAARVKAIEVRIKERIATAQPSTTPEQAAQIANGIGYTSSSGLVASIGASSNDFESMALGTGYQAGLTGKEPLYTPEAMNGAVNDYANIKKASLAQPAKPAPTNEPAVTKNIEAGQAFLTQNSQKEGVFALPSGLQYEVLQEGDGEQPTINSTVTTHYKGLLMDGTVFDSSYERGQPASFPLRNVIKGWQQGIPLMKKGAKYRFFIPARLAYGNRGMEPKIPGGALLIFEVELLGVK